VTLASASAEATEACAGSSGISSTDKSGTAGTPPVNSTLFESGAGAPLPSGAPPTPGGRVNTPAEDRALQEYFATLAKRYTAEASEHARLAQTYRGTRIGHVAAEHDRLAQFARNSARQATAAADRYAQLANLPR
jgi:hypothetical protein